MTREFGLRIDGYYAPEKDPDAVLDYAIDWEKWLNGDTIATSEWTVPAGIVAGARSNTDTTTTIWLAGGTVGETYAIENRITTLGGRIQDQPFKITIREK